MVPTLSQRTRSAVQVAVASNPVPPRVGEVSASTVTPLMQIMESVATQFTSALGYGASGKKAKAVTAQLSEVVYKSAKNMPMAKLAQVLDRVKGPPPKTVTVVLRSGTLAVAASQVGTATMTVENLLKNTSVPVQILVCVILVSSQPLRPPEELRMRS